MQTKAKATANKNGTDEQKCKKPSPVSLTYLSPDATKDDGPFEPGEIIAEVEQVYFPVLSLVPVLSHQEIDCLYFIDCKYFGYKSHFFRTMTIVNYLLAIQHGKYFARQWEHLVLTYQLVLQYWGDGRATGYTDFMKITAYKRFPAWEKCAHPTCNAYAEYGKDQEYPWVCKFHYDAKLHEYKYVRKQPCPYFHVYVACYRDLQWALFANALGFQMRYFAS